MWDDDDQTQQRQLASLVSAIQSGNCCAFVGAGLSKPAGYPDWRALMSDLASAAGIRFCPDDMDSPEGLLRFAQGCKNAMDEDAYYDFLREEFGPRGKELFRPIHIDLLNVPFNAFLTTNFDCCLENAAAQTGGISRVQTYPVLDPSYLRNRHIYHLHGRAYDESGTSEAELMVLTESDYDNAYNQSDEIRSLLRDVLQHQSVLFIGFSLTDPPLNAVLEKAWNSFQALRDFVHQHGLRQERDKTSFALLPRGGITPNGGQRTPDLEPELREKLAEEERFLYERGVSVIRYSGDDPFHSELTTIVGDIRKRTAPSLPGVPSTHRSVFGRGQGV